MFYVENVANKQAELICRTRKLTTCALHVWTCFGGRCIDLQRVLVHFTKPLMLSCSNWLGWTCRALHPSTLPSLGASRQQPQGPQPQELVAFHLTAVQVSQKGTISNTVYRAKCTLTVLQRCFSDVHSLKGKAYLPASAVTMVHQALWLVSLWWQSYAMAGNIVRQQHTPGWWLSTSSLKLCITPDHTLAYAASYTIFSSIASTALDEHPSPSFKLLVRRERGCPSHWCMQAQVDSGIMHTRCHKCNCKCVKRRKISRTYTWHECLQQQLSWIQLVGHVQWR